MDGKVGFGWYSVSSQGFGFGENFGRGLFIPSDFNLVIR